MHSEAGIGIPYPAEEHPGGDRNHGYFDLKRSAELIETVPELHNFPELLSLVRELNHRRSIVRSLGCAKSFDPSNEPFFGRKLTSFVRFCFEILQWNCNRENYRMLFDSFESSQREAVPSLSDLVAVEFDVDPAYFRDHKINGWAMTVWNSGLGRDDSEARQTWGRGVECVERFFAAQRTSFSRELDHGLITVS
jgi:hypothetical protein